MAQNISELAEVDSVVFTAQAEDKDGDMLMYILDNTMVDSKYFRIDLPNTGRLVLARPLDYETKQELELVIHVVEMNTKERFNSSARIQITVLDGDDQYPQFLPCKMVSHESTEVCVNPTYRVNITEGEFKMAPLQLSPGPVCAADGDRGLMAAVTYSILPDNNLFQIDNMTGAIVQLKSVESRRDTPSITLNIMASQVNDIRKYSVTEVFINVLAANRHPPRFTAARYKGFIQEDESLAGLVTTYSGRILFLNASDADFKNGTNPKIQFTLKQQSNHTQLFQVMPNGLVLARVNQLHALEQYFLLVIARDEESGEMTNCTVSVEVLRPGQAVPPDPAEPQKTPSLPDLAILTSSLGALVLFTACVVFLIVRAVKAHHHQQSMGRATLAMEKHPSVVNSSKSSTNIGDLCFENEGYSELVDDSNEGPGKNAPKQPTPNNRQQHSEVVKSYGVSSTAGKPDGVSGSQIKHVPVLAVMPVENESTIRSILTNGKAAERSTGRIVWFEDVDSLRSSTPSPRQRPQGNQSSEHVTTEKKDEWSPSNSEENLNQDIVENAGTGDSANSNLEAEIVMVKGTLKMPDNVNAKNCDNKEVTNCKGNIEETKVIDVMMVAMTPPLGQSEASPTPTLSQLGAISPLGQSTEQLHVKQTAMEETNKVVLDQELLENTTSQDDPFQGAPAPSHGSEVITPGSLMQLLEDSIEC